MKIYKSDHYTAFISMLKWSSLLALMVISMLAFLSEIQRAAAISLKAEALIMGDNITVGDVFNDVKYNNDYALAPAPKPGQDIIWNAATLTRIARAFNLAWAPENSMTHLRIRRLATVIPSDEIKDRMKLALEDHGLSPESYEISVEGLSQQGLILPYGMDTSFAIDNIDYDAGQKVVRAILRSPAEGASVKTASLQGYVVDVETIPVLKNRMRRGDVIRASDIHYIKVRSESIAHDVLLRADEIIGSTPRTSINSTSPIRSFDLELPRIVKRGEAVTMVYNNGRIQIETIGKALQNGSKGDLIRILNSSSNQTIQATVTGERLVTIQ